MNNTSLGDRIKYHRKRLGMTQEQLAQRIGVSTQAVSKWENNLSCPDISVLPELAEIFDISVDELLGKDTASGTAPVKEAEPIDEEEEENEAKFEWRIERKKGGILFALYILTVGVLLLLRGLVPAMDISVWTILWTSALVYIGISGMLGHFSLFCLVMTLAGGYFLLSAYQVFAWEFQWSYVIPIALLLWGASLLFDVLVGKKYRRKKRTKSTSHPNQKMHREYSCDNGYLHCDLSFGECRAAVVTPLLRGGSIDTSFGNLTLLIPDKFEVTLEQDTAFSGAPEIKGSPAPTTLGTIRIKADLSFSAMEIRYI